MTPFRDSADPVVRLRIATEGLLSDGMIIRLLEAQRSEQASHAIRPPWYTNLVENLNHCSGAEDAINVLAEAFITAVASAEAMRSNLVNLHGLSPAMTLKPPKTPGS